MKGYQTLMTIFPVRGAPHGERLDGDVRGGETRGEIQAARFRNVASVVPVNVVMHAGS